MKWLAILLLAMQTGCMCPAHSMYPIYENGYADHVAPWGCVRYTLRKLAETRPE